MRISKRAAIISAGVLLTIGGVINAGMVGGYQELAKLRELMEGTDCNFLPDHKVNCSDPTMARTINSEAGRVGSAYMLGLLPIPMIFFILTWQYWEKKWPFDGSCTRNNNREDVAVEEKHAAVTAQSNVVEERSRGCLDGLRNRLWGPKTDNQALSYRELPDSESHTPSTPMTPNVDVTHSINAEPTSTSYSWFCFRRR